MLKTDYVDGVDEVNDDAMNAIGREINALKRRVFYIDEYGANATGATDSNQALLDAYGELDGKPGRIILGVGTYLFYLGLNADVDRLLTPGQGVFGQGAGLTVIDYRGPGSFLEFRDLDFDNPDAPHQHGGCVGMTIAGWYSGEDDACGIRYGDIWRPRIFDIEIAGFTRPGCKGLWGDNQSRWSERAQIQCVANQNTENFVFESNTGEAYSGSFDYSRYDLSFIAQPNQHGFILRSGTDGSAVSMNGVDLTLTGNCQRGAGNLGEMFRVGKDNDDEAGFSGTLNIGVETSGSTGESHFDFMMGDGPSWDVKSRVSATGAINLIPYSGADFQQGNATPQTFAFAGLLKNSPALGSTGTVQAFQPLQLLSQARGNWYLDTTDCVQVLYITKATGGTFPLTYGGDTTPTPLAHNATPAQVETALRALPSVGANVWVYAGQPRFVNGVAQDEHAYILWFGGALGSTDLPLVTTSAASLTGTGHAAEVVTKAPGSPHGTYVVPLEQGNICKIDPPAGTYRLRSAVGGLTKMSAFGDSPFGVTTVDIWIKQPDTGGPAIFEGPWFVPEALSGSSYHFEWMDGQTPVLSTTPGAFDIIRLTSYNFSTWIGQHITKAAATSVAAATHAATLKSPPADADEFPIADSAGGWGLRKTTGTTLKSWLKAWYDAVTSTLTNKSIALGANTLTGTLAEFNTALTDADFATLRDVSTVTTDASTLPAAANTDYVVMANIAGDQYINSVLALFDFNGSNGATAFTDKALSPLTWTVRQQAQLSTAVKKYGSASLLLDGTGDSLTTAASPLFNFSGIAFTVECWVNPTTLGDRAIFSQNASGSIATFDVRYATNGKAWLLVGDSAVTAWSTSSAYSTNAVFAAGTWAHVALVGDGTSLKLYVDGNLVITYSQIAWAAADRPMLLGAYSTGNTSTNFAGYIDSFRVTRGVARYTGTFTPPAAELPAPTSLILPSAATVGKSQYTVKNINAAPLQLKGTSGQTFDGAASLALASGATARVITPDAANWRTL